MVGALQLLASSRCSSSSSAPLTPSPTPSNSASSCSRGRKRRRWFEDPHQLQQKPCSYAISRSESFTHSRHMARSELRASSSARLDLNNVPVLPRPVGGKCRSPSPPRKVYQALRLAKPGVFCVTPENIFRPTKVVKLHSRLLRDLEVGFIPASFKVRFEASVFHSLPNSCVLVDSAPRKGSLGFDLLNQTQFGPSEQHINVTWDTVHRIYTKAQSCYRDGKDENEWVAVIREVFRAVDTESNCPPIAITSMYVLQHAPSPSPSD